MISLIALHKKKWIVRDEIKDFQVEENIVKVRNIFNLSKVFQLKSELPETRGNLDSKLKKVFKVFQTKKAEIKWSQILSDIGTSQLLCLTDPTEYQLTEF